MFFSNEKDHRELELEQGAVWRVREPKKLPTDPRAFVKDASANEERVYSFVRSIYSLQDRVDPRPFISLPYLH